MEVWQEKARAEALMVESLRQQIAVLAQVLLYVHDLGTVDLDNIDTTQVRSNKMAKKVFMGLEMDDIWLSLGGDYSVNQS